MLVASCVSEYNLYFETFLLIGGGTDSSCLLELLNAEDHQGGLVNRVGNPTLSNPKLQYGATEQCVDAFVESYTLLNISDVFCVT